MTSVAAVSLLAFTVPASAHAPVVLDACDTVPKTSPLIPVGTDPIAFFSVLPHAGAHRAAQFTMKAGEQLNVSYGIPDLAPENGLTTDRLPVVVLIAPDHSVTVLKPDIRVPQHNSHLNQDHLLLNNHSTTAVAGTYSLLAIGRAPSRILVGTGVEDSGFHGVLRGSLATVDQIQEWYSTPPTHVKARCATTTRPWLTQS
ncbi:hypothetical protein ACH4TV_32405 [Streptomyces sp. NPDC020898]|uniref:hypothetical protein n=1 Tax=Streptomyces sp. NPDC020898 TaxID=3365101 RepID=UPI003799A0D3